MRQKSGCEQLGIALSTVTAFAALTWARPVRAADAAEPLSIAYEATASCPDSLAFFGEITGRTTRARLPRRAEPARMIRVRIARDGAGAFAGRLTAEEPNGEVSSSRDVNGDTCQEVVEALAFVAALSVDPSASRRPVHHRVHEIDEVPPPMDTRRGARPRAYEIDEDLPLLDTSPRSPHFRTYPIDEAAPPVPSFELGGATRDAAGARPRAFGALRPRFGVGTHLEAANLAGVVPIGRMFAEIDFDHPSAPIVAPSVRIGVARSVEVERRPSSGAATLEWAFATIEPCPVRFRIADGVAIRPCGGFAAGFLGVQGQGVANALSRTRPWFAVSGQVRLSWELASVLAFEVEGGVMTPLLRETFSFGRQDGSVYTAPSVAMLGRAGASVHFP